MRKHRSSILISLVLSLLAGLVVAVGSSAAAPALSAHGSAKQVYVTGATPGAKVELLNRVGHKVAVRTAGALGGVLFREVQPGSGYRVQVLPHGKRSAPITVHSEAPADRKSVV